MSVCRASWTVNLMVKGLSPACQSVELCGLNLMVKGLSPAGQSVELRGL